jgi:hypothetical protein
MDVIKPFTVTDSVLSASSIAEPDGTLAVPEVAWVSGTANAVDDIRIRTQTHRKYQCSVATSPGTHHIPPEDLPTHWTDIGPTNKWALFDAFSDTVSTDVTTFSFKLLTSNITDITFFNLAGLTIQVIVRNGVAGPIVFDETQSLDGTLITNWFEYLFEPYDQKYEALFSDIPSYLNQEVEVILSSGTGEPVGIGACVPGTSYYLGATKYGLSVGIKDYSIKSVDEFGNTTLTRRRFSRKVSGTLELKNTQLNKVFKLLSGLTATPAVYVSVSDDDTGTYSFSIVYGYFNDFNIEVPYAYDSLCSIEIEGLT